MRSARTPVRSRAPTSRPWPGRRGLASPLAVALAAMLVVALAPEGRLACAVPEAREASPDGAWTLILCRRPMWFAMPGGSSDAPGWVVLRDRGGAIRGVTSLSMVQMYGAAPGTETAWLPDRVERSLVTEMPLPRTRNAALVWLDDRLWRLRALLGMVRTDDAFH